MAEAHLLYNSPIPSTREAPLPTPPRLLRPALNRNLATLVLVMSEPLCDARWSVQPSGSYGCEVAQLMRLLHAQVRVRDWERLHTLSLQFVHLTLSQKKF